MRPAPKRSRILRPLVIGACLLLCAALLAHRARSFSVTDEITHIHADFHTPQLTAPPPPINGLPQHTPYPDGTTCYHGAYRKWTLRTYHGVAMIGLTTADLYSLSTEPAPELAAQLGWASASAEFLPGGFPTPRGNSFTSFTRFYWNGLGTWGGSQDGYATRTVLVPHWLVATLLTLPAAWFGARALVRRARRRPGRCDHCGYDTSATAGACPECGHKLHITTT